MNTKLKRYKQHDQWLKFIKVLQWNPKIYLNLMQGLDKVVMAAKINNAHILYIPVPHDYCDYQ